MSFSPSEFIDFPGIEYFSFEEDFIEENVRCIPMIVRFKLDAAGIKLKLKEWSRFNRDEKMELTIRPCNNRHETKLYGEYLKELIGKYMNEPATLMEVELEPLWTKFNSVPFVLLKKAREYSWDFTIEQWRGLTDLQRFTLLKLCRQGHENRNFPKAMKEFGFPLESNRSEGTHD